MMVFSFSSEGPFGPVCEKCQCHGHADTCHPITGECVDLQCIGGECPECYPGEEGCEECVGDNCGPGSDPMLRCHFRPKICEEVPAGEITVVTCITY